MNNPFYKTKQQMELEALKEQIKQNAADNAYIAMMCDVELGDDENDEEQDV